MNIMNIKSNKKVLAVIAVLSFVFAYLYDKWKYNIMWERCQASDMADSKAYAFVNHHSSLDFMLEGVCLALILWIIVKVIATITRKKRSKYISSYETIHKHICGCSTETHELQKSIYP